MPFVQRIPGSSQQAYKKDKVPNEQFRFLTATTGFRYLYELGSVIAPVPVVSGAGRIFTLPFNYLVGQKQLIVYLLDSVTGFKTPLINATDYAAALAAGTVITPFVGAEQTFTELTKNTVFIDNCAGTENVEFFVPHTSVPGQNRNRIVIEDQVDSVALQMLGANDGFELLSPNGTAFIVTVTNGGAWLIRPK